MLFVILSFSMLTKYFGTNYQTFDYQVWNSQNHFYRINYVEDLISNGKLEGKCYDEITEMLGQPRVENNSSLEYDIGFGTMIVHLDNNCFKKVEVKCIQ